MSKVSKNEFLGNWGQLNNTDFKPIEFDGFKNQDRRQTGH